MRAIASTLLMISARSSCVWVLLAVLLAPAFSARASLPFELTISGNANTPIIALTNQSRVPITEFEMTIGNYEKNFDWAKPIDASDAWATLVTLVSPDTVNGSVRSDKLHVRFNNGLAPGQGFRGQVDVDHDNSNTIEDYRKVFFNNGDKPNAVITVYGPNGLKESLTLPDTGAADLDRYTFESESRPRTLRLDSRVDESGPGSDPEPFIAVTLRITDPALANTLVFTNLSTTNMVVYDGETVEISAPPAVYRDLHGIVITNSVADQELIQTTAEERLTAIGITVNDVPQTGDPTFYRFEVTKNTTVKVRWRYEFALTVKHDFSQTQENDSGGQAWAGPLTSDAEGNPEPAVKKHWIKRGETVIAKIDGQVLDFTRPGLDIRYVPKANIAYGPPNGNTSASQDHEARVTQGMDIRTNSASLVTNQFTVGQSPPQRQQVPEFTMYGPAGITYVWQIQFGIKVNVDDVSRAALPKVFVSDGNGFVEAGTLEGVFWFNPGTRVVVASAANAAGANSDALKGWINGDGYYFSSSGDINTSDGTLTQGGPAIVGTSPVAIWRPELNQLSGLSQLNGYRGLEIPQLRRPARVLWQYGKQAHLINAAIGEFVFQHHAALSAVFTNQPDQIVRIAVAGANQNVGDGEMAVWDPVAAKLYPLVPGQFRAVWKPDAASTNSVDVIVSVTYPQPAHYPHIAGTPPVALDPDPEDYFVFKELKYTENSAVVDGSKQFTATRRGKSVLLFTEIQQVGRGELREFMRVRVVDTKDYQEQLSFGAAIIGRKIEADDLDGARLGTGYVMSFQEATGEPDRARFNPFIYDASRLNGIAAKDIYDLARLRSDAAEKVVVHKDRLPGPIIPVNLHPGAAPAERVIVVWYADPAQNDEILWPHRARLHIARWPANASEGLGRIVIASQFGSESQIFDPEGNLDQEVVPAIGNSPAQSTYNPSRLQQVTVYSQPDRNQRGYNPNEEHALMAPSLRFVDVSPRPPAAYALRNNDLNIFNKASPNELNQPLGYTSHPFVLVQFFDTADREFKMRVYQVQKEDKDIPNYSFASQTLVSTNSSGVATASPHALQAQPHVVMEAGEPVIPFYPLVEVIGASPCIETFGINIKQQTTYWEDHKGSSWSVSGGTNAWFTASFYYPLAPDFWWPPGKPGRIQDSGGQKRAQAPEIGDCISFVPEEIEPLLALQQNALLNTAVETKSKPVKVLFKSDWPKIAPVLKAGETMTFQGGEFRADDPFMPILDADGQIKMVETPGLPGVVAFAAAEVVFDSLNPTAHSDLWRKSWTARVAQVLDQRNVVLPAGSFPDELKPATGRTRVSQGKYVFNDLPASLQKRLRYDPMAQTRDPNTGLLVSGKLEMNGLLNDKGIGEPTLTASPPAVYVLEPNILTEDDVNVLLALDDGDGTAWDVAVLLLYEATRNPEKLNSANEYLVGLEREIKRNSLGEPLTETIEGITRFQRDPARAAPYRAFGPGLALLPNAGFLDPEGTIPDPNNPGSPGVPFPEISWVSVAENNDPSLGGSPITIHVIKVDRRERYRGSIKTVTSDNVFDENLVLRHTGDFGANADELFFEWWYRPDDGSLNVPPPDLLKPGQPNPWKLFPDPSGKRGLGRFETTLKGNPNAPEALLADTWWFVRYRHKKDRVEGGNWNVSQLNGEPRVNFTWAGAGNSDPKNDFDDDGLPDYRAQLAQGWIKRVLDAVNPYEARIRDFETDSPSTASSMIAQFGARFEGAVALNPAKDVIENVGLIELYETILKRGRDLSIDLSRPVATPAIANALQLASTRISDFYTILGNEAYTDAMDPTIGFGSDSAEYGSLAPAVFAFQNQLSSVIEEELALLRGVDDFFARPVYNRLFWNFTKGEGEAAYAMNYNISDVNQDGFIDEDDAMILYPQGHGDAWGHYLTALRNQYELLQHPNFNWVSRSEFYNLQDIVIKVDFLDERKFAQTAAVKAKTGAEIVHLTYRSKYLENPTAQWQGYTDSHQDRAWGVQEWARRAGQGAYFDWVTANALLPSEHPNETLEGIQKVNRKANAEIAVISANMNSVQTTFDRANKGQNPVGLAGNVVPFDIDPARIPRGTTVTATHFEQVYERAVKALENASAIWDNANQTRNLLRRIANSESEFRNKVFQEDLAYRNRLIKIFGKPYAGTIGPGKVYPAGYAGPDLLLFMYVDVREINDRTVPGPSTNFATFNAAGKLTAGEIYQAFQNGQGRSLGGIGGSTAGRQFLASLVTFDADTRRLFNPTFVPDTDGNNPAMARDGWYGVNYTDLSNPKIPLENLAQLMPIMAAGYTFQAPQEWETRLAVGELQLLINKMLQQEAQIASAIGAWDSLQGEIVRTLRLLNAKLDVAANLRVEREAFTRLKLGIMETIKGIEVAIDLVKTLTDTTIGFSDATKDMLPKHLPTAGLSFSPGDALAPGRGGIEFVKVSTVTGFTVAESAMKLARLVAEISLDIAQNKHELFEKREGDLLSAKEMLASLENLVGDEPIKRIAIFKEIQVLREHSDRYRALVDEGTRLIDERTAYNKRVAAQTQRNRYQDMTFRVGRNHALQNYQSSLDLAARYAYLAAKAYDYETNFDPSDPASPMPIYGEIVRARGLGHFAGGQPRMGKGGLSESLAKLKANYDVVKGQIGISNPQLEIGKISMRTELFRILPKGGLQPTNSSEFPSPGANADIVWKQRLMDSRVDDLWMLPEFRFYCRPFVSESDGSGLTHVPQPGLVIRFSTEIFAGKNFFGKPLSGADHAYDPSSYATKVRSVGVWFSDYLSGSVINDLPATPRVYLVPTGMDIMRISSGGDPNRARLWHVADQTIPVPFPAATADLERTDWIPILDSLNGRLGDPRRFASLRAYHNGSEVVNLDEMVFDSRLIGRSIWNTEWLLIVPGLMLNADPEAGLNRFINQVSDIKLVFQTYGYAGN